MSIRHQKTPFSVFMATTVVFFGCALSAADSIGFVPYYIDGTSPGSSIALADLPQLGDTAAAASANSPVHGVDPARIEIPAISLDLPVQNPATRDIGTLDTLLQNGPARYVDSAILGGEGNVLIFAHSSHLPIVHNQMFRAFNHIPDLQIGDEIDLIGADGKTYAYKVTGPAGRVDTGSSDAIVDLSRSKGRHLTLVTCDTLTGKSARFVLHADFVR